PEQPIEHSVGGHAVGLRLETQDEAVPERRPYHAFHVLEGDVYPSFAEGHHLGRKKNGLATPHACTVPHPAPRRWSSFRYERITATDQARHVARHRIGHSHLPHIATQREHLGGAEYGTGATFLNPGGALEDPHQGVFVGRRHQDLVQE